LLRPRDPSFSLVIAQRVVFTSATMQARYETGLLFSARISPVAQAADITAFKATVVPVGLDQAPMIEPTNEIVRRINRQVGRDLLPEAKALISATGRLPGADGKAKMSKSQGNAISLSATPDEIRAFVNRMYTDPNHLRVSDPGKLKATSSFHTLMRSMPTAPLSTI